MYCTKCGKEVSDDNKFCIYCGNDISSKEKKAVYYKKGWLWGIGGIVLVGVLLIGILTSGKNGEGILGFGRTSRHSIWFDGQEFKVLEYLDDQTMCVKFLLGKYMVQAVVPRTLEANEYLSEQYSESDSAGENSQVYLKLINSDKGDALYYAYGRGPQIIADFTDVYEEWQSQIDDETIYEIETLDNGSGIVTYFSDYVSWSDYDKDERLLEGYMVVFLDEEEQGVFMFGLLTDDESQHEMIQESIAQIVVREKEDDDLVLKAAVSDDYEQRMEDMFQKYREIVKSPDKYLQTEYNAPGSDYNYHYLYDVTGDGVPEVFFQGNPRQLCIVGEKNGICINGVNEIIWADEERFFYTKMSSQAGVNWTKYEVIVDEEGNIEVVDVANLDINHEGKYSLNGESVTREKYLKVMPIIERLDAPKPRQINSDESVASKTGFYNSVKRLTDEFVYK